MTDALEAWFWAELKRCGFLKRYPLYTYIVSRFELRSSGRVDAMAVSGEVGRPVLHINRAFFEDGAEFLPGVLLHEIHHVVLGHLTDPRFRGPVVPLALTIATEISANEDIHEPLPGKPIRLERFSHLGIAPRQSTWERYEILAASIHQEPREQFSIPESARCCAKHVMQPTSGAVDARLIAALLRGSAQSRPNGLETIAGRTPGELLESLSDALSLDPLNWRELLRDFARSSRGRIHSYSRPNRRFPSRVGEVPGTSRRRSEDRTRLLVAIDTSSSMAIATVNEVFAELNHLASYADITIVECDAAIQRVYPLARRSGDVKGRGGTDLRPPFEHVFLQKHRPAGIVYFTDGAGPYPETPPRVPTLWVLTQSAPFSCPWGRRVRMDGACSRRSHSPLSRSD